MTPASVPGFYFTDRPNMQPLDVFLPYLTPWVGGCPVPLAHQSLVRSARSFCEETNVITRMSEPVELVPGEAVYDIDLDTDTDAIRLLAAWLGATPLHLPTVRDARSPLVSFSDLGAGVIAQSGTPTMASSEQANTVTLYPPPGDTPLPKLTVRVATRPKITARSLDDALFTRWADAVVSGAVAIIAALPGQPFSDLNQATIADARFWRAVNKARIEAQRGDVGTSLRVRNNPLV